MENFFDYLIDVQDERFRSMASPTQNDKWKAVIQWFEGERNFLIIYDGIEFAPEEFIRYLPQTASGHFIFTSHHSSIQTLGETREIKEMNNKDAIELLLQRSKLETHYANQVEKEMDTLPIVHILDKTPGLIDIAAKYILVNRISLRQYRRTLDEYQRTAQQSLPRDMFKGAFDSLSLALNSLRPQQASMQLLRLFSFLDGSQIDSFLFVCLSPPDLYIVI
jgi:hypothetical protein